MSSGMSLGRRVELLFALVTGFLLMSLVADLWFIQERSRFARQLDTELEPARAAVNDVSQGLVDQETGERGYVITHDPAFLQPYAEGQRLVDDALVKLRRLVGDDPAHGPSVDRLEARVSAWRQVGAEYEIGAVRAGRFDEAAALVSSGTGRRLFDQARTELAGLRDGLVAEQAAVDARLRGIRLTLSALTIAGALSGLLLLGLGASLLKRWVSRPLMVLGAAVRAVAAGDLRRSIPSPGPPELARLGADVEAMRQRILAEVDEAGRARDALLQRGMVVLSLSERLHPEGAAPAPGIRVSTRWTPASGVVAGDWCEVVSLGPGRSAVIVVDVAGHGAEAGIFALRTKELTLAALDIGCDPGEAFAWVAARLGDTDERFLTGVIAVVDDDRGTLRYANAGHPSLVVVDGDAVQTLDLTGPVVGPALGLQSWASVEVALSASAVVVACSDGVLETRDKWGDEFGLDRLAAEVVEAAREADATSTTVLDEIAERCLRTLDAFRAGEDHHDDVTLVVFGRTAEGATSASQVTAAASAAASASN